MAAGGVDQIINAQGIAHSCLHHKPGIVNQVVSGNDILIKISGRNTVTILHYAHRYTL